MFGSKRKKADIVPEVPIVKLAHPASLRSSNNGIATRNGAASSARGVPTKDEAQRRAAAALRLSVAFAQIVTVLMRSPLHKHFFLGDLEWLVVPPLLAGQCRVVEAKVQSDGPGVPIAAALWASVAPEVDKRLSENVNAPIRLRPDEWKSGDILWLVEVIGDGRVVPPLLKQLSETAFKGREVKLRIQAKGSNPSIGTLQQVVAEQPQPAAQRG